MRTKTMEALAPLEIKDRDIMLADLKALFQDCLALQNWKPGYDWGVYDTLGLMAHVAGKFATPVELTIMTEQGRMVWIAALGWPDGVSEYHDDIGMMPSDAVLRCVHGAFCGGRG